MKTINKTTKNILRDEIENIIKQYNIDRNNFYEYSKLKYRDIIDKFLKNFVETRYSGARALSACWLDFKAELVMEKRIREEAGKWTEFLGEVKDVMPKSDTKFYLILDEAWVYEGCADEIFAVLNETTTLMEDFYIVSRKFDWMISYVSEGYTAVLLRKK